MTEQELREKIVRIIDKAFDDFARDATSDAGGFIADALIAAGIGDVKETKFESDHYWRMWQGALVELERAEHRAEVAEKIAKEACLSKQELKDYIRVGESGYGWHIIDQKLFDKPIELGEFYTICNKYGDDSCGDCPYLAVEQCSFPCDDCVDTWCSVDNIKPITRPPQSWCYVEELQ